MKVYKESALVIFLTSSFHVLRAPLQYLPSSFYFRVLCFSLYDLRFYWLVQIESGSSVRSANIFVFKSPVCGTSFLLYISIAVEFMIRNGTRDS